MFKSLLFRWSPLRRIPKECMFNFAEVKSNVRDTQWRQLSISVSCYKKRRPAEEKAIESHGRGVIRYSPKAGTEVVGIWRNMTVQDIAKVLNKDVDHVFRALEFADKNSDVRYTPTTVIHNQQIVRDVIKISGCRFKIVPPPDEIVEDERNKDALPPPPAPESELLPRPPVVCVMGHVDHGKTTLLDALRDSSLVDDEFGGITQHIGAFVVKLPTGESVTFLDTPGHAAFSAMRARGAHTADVVVLVVAGDDGVMDQTLEAVRMAREAAVPIVVAVNKIDKPGVNIERTLASLASHGVVAESLGGEVQAVAISAKQRTGLQDLLAALLLQASLLELKAPIGPPVTGVVLDTSLGAATGKQATVLVQRGTLERGCVLVAGQGWGKVRLLLSAEGQPLRSAGPALPARVLGWRDLPAAGDLVLEVSTEQRAREVVRWRESQRLKQKAEDDLPEVIAREEEHREKYLQHLRKKRSLGRMRLRREGPRAKMLQEDTHPALRVIVKGDVDGSVEAILDVLDTYDEHDRVRLDLVHFGVGALTPGDIEIAEAFKAVIYLFNVECSPALAAEAKGKNVPVKAHNVIYRLVDDVKAEINDRIPPVQEEEILGEANVLQEFHISEGKKKVPVAGCRCVRGVLQRNARYRLVRSGEVVYDGKLVSMKHLKDEVSSIKRDMECGLRLADAGVSLRPGDQLVCYVMRDAKPSTGWDPGF